MHKIKRLKNNLYYIGQGHVLPCFQMCVCVISNQMLAKLRITGGLVKTDYWTLFPKLEIQQVCIWYQNLRIFISSKFPGDTNAVDAAPCYTPLTFAILFKMQFPPSYSHLPDSLLHSSQPQLPPRKVFLSSKTMTTFKGYSP